MSIRLLCDIYLKKIRARTSSFLLAIGWAILEISEALSAFGRLDSSGQLHTFIAPLLDCFDGGEWTKPIQNDDNAVFITDVRMPFILRGQGELNFECLPSTYPLRKFERNSTREGNMHKVPPRGVSKHAFRGYYMALASIHCWLRSRRSRDIGYLSP